MTGHETLDQAQARARYQNGSGASSADGSANDNPHRGPAVLSSADFVRGFTPPDFLWDGILQRGFLYSLTAPTGAGKTSIALLIAARCALLQSLAGREVQGGRVAILAGENADDTRMRWMAMAERMGFDINAIDVHFIAGTFSFAESANSVIKQLAELGECALVIVDTSAAYFEGGEENSNVELGNHARMLRRFTGCVGRPVVLALCHPTKNAGPDNMLPRGGGAFLAEVDGNLVLKLVDLTVEMHWQGKLRGPGFEPVMFELIPTTATTLKDSRGRQLFTVVAHDLSKSEADARHRNAMRLEDQVLLAVDNLNEPSVAEMAQSLSWVGSTGEPQKSRVHSFLKRLEADGMVSKGRRGQYILTTKGKQEALRLTKTAVQTPERSVHGSSMAYS